MNNLSDLKAVFLKEHARDRRLTLINYGLILGVIALVLGLLFYIGVDFKGFISDFINQNQNVSDNSWINLYAVYAPIIAFVVICAYPFYVLLKLSKRPKQIDKLISHAEKGAKLANTTDYVAYKITIPLIKINLKLAPVTFIQIFFEGDIKPYVLPIRKAYIPDMKILLSGVNIEDINKHKDELYGDSENETENIVATPLKTVDEFRAFVDKELKTDVEALESSRKSSRKVMVVGGIIAGIATFGVVGYVIYTSLAPTLAGDYNTSFNPLTTIVPIFVVGLVISIVMNVVMKKKHANTQTSAVDTMTFGNNTFKEKIISRMVSFINPSVKYIPLAHLALEDVFESGLFEQRNYILDGSDQISGRHNGVPFISCDLTMQYERSFTKENEQPDTVFHGQFFVARFNKTFSTPVYIIPKKNKYGILSHLVGGKGEDVKLEDPEFMKMFNVYSNDQIEARYILTPSLMERIKELAIRTKGEFYIAFYNNKITVANNSGINNFETGYSKSITKKDNELLIGFYIDMCNQFAIIDELKLNLNIWKK